MAVSRVVDVRVTGLADWENAESGGLPDVDLLHWWLATQPVELGAAVRQVVAQPAEVRQQLAELSIELPNPQLALEHLALLTWLRHVTAGMDRTSADHLGRVWLARNVKPILQLLADSGADRTRTGCPGRRLDLVGRHPVTARPGEPSHPSPRPAPNQLS